MNRIIQASEEEFLQIVRLAVREEMKSFVPANMEQRAPATKKEAADHLGISLPTLDQLIKTKQLKSFNIGRSVRFRWVDIEAYLDKK